MNTTHCFKVLYIPCNFQTQNYTFPSINYSLTHIHSDYSFLTLLRWKAHQNLALFLLDNDRQSDNDNDDDDHDIIAPVWRRFSLRLQALHDPTVRDGKYNQLIFDEKYWKYKSKACKNNHNTPLFQDRLNLHMTEYCVNWKDVLRELCVVTMRFKTMQIILNESNSTLQVVTNYIISDEHSKRQQHHRILLEQQQQQSHKEEEEDKLLNGNWWIADDYHDDDDDDMEIVKEFDDFVKNEIDSI